MKISLLEVVSEPDGTETIPMVKDGQTRRGALGSLVGALAAPYASAAELARDQVADLARPENTFVAIDLATARSDGELATVEGVYFRAVGLAEGEMEVRVRTVEGSDLLYSELTKTWFASPDPEKGVGTFVFQPSAEAGGVGVPQLVRRNLEQEITTLELSADGSDVKSLLQAKLDAAGANPRAGQREVVIRGGSLFGLSGAVQIPSNVRLITDGDARLVPTTDGVSLVQVYGAEPASDEALTADAGRGAQAVKVADNSAYAVGNYVWLTSEKVIDTSPNSHDLVIAQMARVVYLDGSTDLVLDRMLEYDFLVSDNATVGVVDCRHNIAVDNLKLGVEGGYRFLRGFDARYFDALRVSDFDGGWNRRSHDVVSDYDDVGWSALAIKRGGNNAVLERITGTQTGWYLVEIDGACHDVVVRDVSARRVRHAVSVNWNGPGEPVGVLVENVNSEISGWAGVDTHDVGRDITLRKIRCVGSLNDGLQIRTSNVLVERYIGQLNATNGLTIRTENSGDELLLNNIKLRQIEVSDNARRGILSQSAIDLEGGFAARNGSDAYPNVYEKGGIHCPAGRIANFDLIDNSDAAIVWQPPGLNSDAYGPLRLDTITAPASSHQTVFIWSSISYATNGLTLRDVRAQGYATADLFRRNGSTVILGVEHSGCHWGTGARFGAAQLMDGTVTVDTDQIRQENGSAGRFKSELLLTRLTQGADPGELSVAYEDATGFTITSSSAADNSNIQWRIV